MSLFMLLASIREILKNIGRFAVTGNTISFLTMSQGKNVIITVYKSLVFSIALWFFKIDELVLEHLSTEKSVDWFSRFYSKTISDVGIRKLF